MKWLFAALSVVAICNAQESIQESEVVTLEPGFLNTQPVSIEEMSLPSPQIEIPHKDPFIAVGLSCLFPGLGHTYLGDMRTAGELMGSTGASIGLIPLTMNNENYFASNLIVLGSISQYGIYAAYRDVRNYNQQSGYTYQMPRDSFTDLLTAPFSFRVIKKPEVWGGFLGIMAAAMTTAYFAFPQDAHIHLSSSAELGIPPYVAFPIGIGEEALFWGVLQSELSERLGPWGGIALSSLVFGAAHIPNAQAFEPEEQWRYYSFSIPLITALGAYFGWVAHKNHSLRESVALHGWYDFTLFALEAWVLQSASTRRPASFRVAFPLSF